MADSRINALTTTATSTASDDFFVVDGTTNGTRKLNAFSPTFGGNATVTGTLTVSGTGASSFGGRLAIGATALSDRMFYVSGNTGTTGASQFSAVVNPTIPNTVTTAAYGLYLGTNIAAGATVTNGYSLFIAAPDYTGSTVTNKYGLYSNDPNPSYFVGNVLVGSTTASTSTSTGALVVSGGVGVAGAIHSGNNIRATGNLYAGDSSVSTGAVSIQVGDTRTGSGYAHLDLVGDTTYSDYGLRLIRGNSGANATSGLTHRGTGELHIATEEAASILLRTANTTALTITSAQQVQVNATTASTSTSTGALVVSGGVGVAGASWFGSTLVTVGTLWNSGTSNVTTNGFNDATTIASNVITIYGSTGSNNIQKAGKITTFDGGSGYYGLNLQVPTSAYPDFSGTVNFTNALTLTSQQIKINPTTASTSTSTGALVVSGGVGVAGAIYAGGMIQSGGALQASMGGTTNATTLNLIGGGSSDGNYLNFADVNIGGQGLGAAFLRWTRDNGLGRAFSIHVSNNAGSTTTAAWFDVSGNVIQKVNGTAPSLTSNSTMTFELTSNTSLKIFVRGSDGTTRSTTLTLA